LEIEQLLREADPTECRLMSYRNTLNGSAGMWLRTQCRYEQFRLTKNQFCVALCLRYHLKIPLIPETTHQCACCKGKFKIAGSDQMGPCTADQYGHHFTSSCAKDLKGDDGSAQFAQPHAIHDVLRRTLHQLSTQAMVISAVQEPKEMLFVEGAEKQVRPDLSMTIPARNMRLVTYAVDIGVVCPFKGSKSGNIRVDHDATNPANTHDKRVKDYKKKKNDKYKEICRTKGFSFVPFMITSTGKIHQQGLTLLSRMAHHASAIRNIPAKTLYKYYIKVMNLTLFRQVTRTILLKAVGNHDKQVARQISDNTMRSVNRLVHVMSEQPHLSAHNIFPDM